MAQPTYEELFFLASKLAIDLHYFVDVCEGSGNEMQDSRKLLDEWDEVFLQFFQQFTFKRSGDD
jgi:hypothetical protein